MATEEQRPPSDSGQSDKPTLDRNDEEHDFVDQSKIDFDPDDGLYSGTAVNGTSEIAGPHIDTESGELTGMDEVREQAAQLKQDQQSRDE
jgi:hypothetical protein